MDVHVSSMRRPAHNLARRTRITALIHLSAQPAAPKVTAIEHPAASKPSPTLGVSLVPASAARCNATDHERYDPAARPGC
jgi:hypothetical protein